MCSLASLTPPPFGRPAGVYPDENRGRNDVKQHQTNFFTASGRARKGVSKLFPKNMIIRKEIAGSLVLFLFGVVFLLYDLKYPLDQWANPGPAVFPLMVGTV